MKRRKRVSKTSLGDKAAKALHVAVSKALTRHKTAGVPAAVWINGKVSYLSAKSKSKK